MEKAPPPFLFFLFLVLKAIGRLLSSLTYSSRSSKHYQR